MAPDRVNQPTQGPATPSGHRAGRPPGPRWRDWVDPRKIGWFRMLLVFVPVTLVASWSGAPGSFQFAAALLAILPLAAVMGEATEHLAHRAGPGIGGLLNATFGNAAELIIALALLFQHKDRAVKASITGSILGNILLVLGGSLLAGGVSFRTLRFNRTAVASAGTMLVLAAIGLLVPAIFHSLPEVLALEDSKALNIEHELSLAVCVALMVTYLLGLVFSLRTHRDLFNPVDEAPSDAPRDSAPSTRHSVTVLLIATVFVAMVSEVVAKNIEEAGHQWGLTEVFLGVVVVAIVGNAAEHSSAILVARKNQMDLAVGIALGSALQIALFVAPVLVFASYLRAEPTDLLFTTMEVVAVILGVLVARMVVEDGESNWLEGAMLLMVYVILGVAFYVLPDEPTRPSAANAMQPPQAAATAPALP